MTTSAASRSPTSRPPPRHFGVDAAETHRHQLGRRPHTRNPAH